MQKKMILNDSDEYDYWSKMLGKSTLDTALNNFDSLNVFDDERLSDLREALKTAQLEGECDWLKDECFYPFYGPLLGLAETYLSELRQLAGLWAKPEIRSILMKLLFGKAEALALRTLIAVMSILKQKGELKGEDPKGEYAYFVSHYLMDPAFCKNILEKYPMIPDLFMKHLVQLGDYLSEFVRHFQTDQKAITDFFFGGEAVGDIKKIDMNFSDAHFGGKSVIKVYFENDRRLIYKPRSMKNDVLYQEIYGTVAAACGLDVCEYKILDREDYGWSEFLNRDICETTEQLHRYYQRLGVQIFICYLFSIKDMHYENMLAVGEYPVIIDLETFPGRSQHLVKNDAAGTAIETLANSILTTGALPMAIWNFDGKGVRFGAVGVNGRQKLPVKVPVAIYGKTSDMKIVTVYPEVEMKDNLPLLNGTPVNPAMYTTDLVDGFNKAYGFACDHKDLMHSYGENVYALNSRCMIRNTQQYSMYMNTAGFPAFMTARHRQQLFFWQLYNSDKVQGPWKAQIIGYEAASLCGRDIPYFYTNGKRCALFDSLGHEYENYLRETPFCDFEARLAALDEADRKFQLGIIRLSMDVLPAKGDNYVNSYMERKQSHRDRYHQEACMDAAVRIGEHLLDMMIYDDDHREVIWPALKYFGNDEADWYLNVQDMYLYDGLAGTGLFLSELWRATGDFRFKDAFMCIRRQLFHYTTKQLENENEMQLSSGIFTGEASLIFAYLLWYEAYEDPAYLIFAEKHSAVLERVFRNDTNFDLIGGNAGAMVAWLRLYEATKNPHYLELAETASGLLKEHIKTMEVGKGWLIKGERVPLAGMSHGNSGFIAVFAMLYAHTHRAEDAELLTQLLSYEDTLFDTDINNWKDMRRKWNSRDEKDDDAQPEFYDSVAWCHGAPGILVARLILKQLCPDICPAVVARDIHLAVAKLTEQRYRRGFCLCHGNCGNGWIMKMASELLPEYKDKLCGEYEAAMGELLEHIEDEDFLPQEWYNAGFMNGVSGMGYALLKNVEVMGRIW